MAKDVVVRQHVRRRTGKTAKAARLLGIESPVQIDYHRYLGKRVKCDGVVFRPNGTGIHFAEIDGEQVVVAETKVVDNKIIMKDLKPNVME